jgi:phenylacetate-CoA ligase
MSVFSRETEGRLLKVFRRAASDVPAYRALLEEHGTRADQVVDMESFSGLCPVLSKSNTFDRFPIDQLCVGGKLGDLATVLTSSGHGGRFSFGVIDKEQAATSADFVDQAFDAAFQIKKRRTLAINCLPMGVSFSSRCMTVATTSVREDMAVALVQAFGRYYDQIVLVCDPLFIKKLTDYANEKALDWSRYRVNVMLGEEIFGEHFRGYIAECLDLHPDRPEAGYIMSSFGTGELGLHLCYETQATIALRRATFRSPEFASDLLGVAQGRMALPMILSFDPQRTFIEVTEPDRSGYGQMTTSVLDQELPLPLLRYQTGDVVRLLAPNEVIEASHRHGVPLSADLPLGLLALKGRDKETLPNGLHTGDYKDALYVNHEIARHFTGAFRLTFSGKKCTLHVQLVPSKTPSADLKHGILQAMPAALRPGDLVLWPHDQFPFGVSLDYERKFAYYVPREPKPPSA